MHGVSKLSGPYTPHSHTFFIPLSWGSFSDGKHGGSLNTALSLVGRYCRLFTSSLSAYVNSPGQNLISFSPIHRIYVIRSFAQSFFKYRISKTQNLLDDLQKQRDATIEKLKEATKYNSTLQLLEKYGAESPASAEKKAKSDKVTEEQGKDGMRRRGTRDRTPVQVAPGERTAMPPPPTANIPRPQYGPSSPATPLRQHQPSPAPLQSPSPVGLIGPPNNQPIQNRPEEPGFHPSAYPTQQFDEPREPQWYDRILDVLLGEDETLPKNRLALICSHCRLVNGQAAPGIRTIEELGRWRCGGCGGWNGQDHTSKRRSGDSEPDLDRQRSRSRSLSQSNPQVVVEPASPVGSTWNTLSNDGSLSSAGVEAESMSGGEGTDASIIHASNGSDEDLDFDAGDTRVS